MNNFKELKVCQKSRKLVKDFFRFLNIRLDSAYELEAQVILAYDLELFEADVFNKTSHDITEIQKMIHGLIKFQTNKQYNDQEHFLSS